MGACLCKHWSAGTDREGGVCGLNFYGGRPSFGTCALCTDYDGPGPRLTGVTPIPDSPLLGPDSETKRALRMIVCETCDENRGFAPLGGTPLLVYSRCQGCSCPQKRVNLLSGNCPRKKWTNV